MDSISDADPPGGGMGTSISFLSSYMLKHFELITCPTTRKKGMDGANNDAVVHFYDKGDYYVALGNGARRIANDIFHSSSVLKYASVNNKTVPMVSVSRKLFASVTCRLLLTESAHVQVWCLEEGSSRNWISKKRGSPGNLGDFSEEIQKESITESDSCLACVYMKREKVGIVVINTILNLFGVCEYECDPDDIAGILKQYGVKEALVCELQLAMLDVKLKAANITVSKRPSRDFFRYRDEDSVLRDCSKLFGVERSEIDAGIIETLTVNVKNPAVLAFSCSMQFIEDNERTNIFQVHRISPLDHMYLNNGAIEALGLTELNKLLNTCQTPMGSRRLKKMILQPLTNLEEIKRRQAIVSSLVDDIELRILVREQILKNCPSAEKTAMRLSHKYMLLKRECLDPDDDYNTSAIKACRETLSDLVSIYKLTQIASKLVTSCENSSSLLHWVNQLREHMQGCAAAVDNLPNVVELESLQKVNGSYFCRVNPRASTQLSHVHNKLQNISHRILQEAKSVASLNSVDNLVIKAHDSGYSSEGKGEQDKKKTKGKPKLTMYLERSSVHGTFFRVTKKDHSSIFYSNQKKKRKFDNGKGKTNRKSESGFRIITSQKDGTKFTSTELDKLNTEYTNMLQDYERHQVKIVRNCLLEFGPYCQRIQKIVDLIGGIDVYAALADTAANRNYCRPEFNTSHEIIIENGRHPVVETLDDINFVPNDCKLRSQNQNSPGNCNMIFGPNMGGKSTYIKTNAIIILLAQMGSFVPAERASLPVCDSILARVGANDNSGIGASTFMVEMCDMATILRRATPNTLVIVDEIGRGTSTCDGYGLAYALIRHLADCIRAYVLVATHFFELKSLGERESVRTVNNYHVTATINKVSGNVIMLYKVRKGATNKSYGIACAKMAGFPQAVVDEANRLCAS